jgi:hypothetical protein
MTLPGGQCYTLVTPNQAKVLASTTEDIPLVTMNPFGKGTTIFLAYSPESALKKLPPEKLAVHPIHHFFRGVAQMAGLQCPAVCPDPRIELDVRRNSDGRLLVVLINHSRYSVETSVAYPQAGREEPVLLTGNEVRIMETAGGL